MIEDEPRPRPRDGFQPPNLEGWSVEDLRRHIEALRAEIVRAEEAIRAREAQRSAADAFFRRP